ncbi:hypothetical protein [Kordia sp.]|uniref:hypothetical protein n=1 Tax=Kordia sp. TaxID=1965332 RepID=UPI0025C3FB52|nr:hypothetical protein [Kordia sp.]MCH2196058.1 hypothetical protein [Kordia sp.]
MKDNDYAYTIKDTEIIGNYVKRTANQNMLRIASVMTILLLLLFWFTYSYHAHTVIMPPMAMMLVGVTVFVYIFSFIQIRNIASKTFFNITETIVEKVVVKEELNWTNQFAQNRLEKKYGEKANRSFLTHEIETTKITPNDIIVKSYDYNLFNANGKIVIPKEINDFHKVKAFILAHPEKFKINS